MRIQTCVQHDPRRAHLLPLLLPALPADAQVVADPGASEPRRSPWRTYLACLRALEPDASHLLICQDDCLPCADFPGALAHVVAARPDDLVALFVPGTQQHGRRVLEACWAGERWAELSPATWPPAVCLVWPRALAEQLLAWQPPERLHLASDDGNLEVWARQFGIRILACVPSLVEHADDVPSLMGTAHMGGNNPGRVAACWLGLEQDWREIFA